MKKLTLLLCIILTSSLSLMAQGYTVSGIVKDELGEVLPGANVYLIGTKKGTITDVNGHFIISHIRTKSYSIRVNFIGYKNYDLKLEGNKRDLIIKLQEAKTKIRSAYVSANVNDIDLREKSGVVDKVRMSELRAKPMIDIGLALQGMVPGLVVRPSGILGSKPIIRIRGNSSLRPGDSANQPLYVLDGKIITAETFMLLNPLDIKSIKVLKDAAACALYGIQAANGVIEVTSMRGLKSKPIITVSSDCGISFRGTRPLKMMRADEKLEYERLAKCPIAPGYIYSSDFINKMYNDHKLHKLIELYNNYYRVPYTMTKDQLIAFGKGKLDSLRKINTDWFKTLLHNHLYQSHYISIRGGNDDVSYFASTGYSRQEGQLPGNSYDKFQSRLSVDWNIGDKGYISAEASGGFAKKTSPNTTNYDLSGLLYQLNSYESPYTKLLYSIPNRGYKDLFNQYQQKSNDLNFSSSLSANFTPIDGLLIAGVCGIDILYNNSQQTTLASSYNEIKSGVPRYERGRISRSDTRTINYSFDVRATYEKLFNEVHDLTLSADFDYYYSNFNNIDVYGYGSGNLDFLNAVNQGINGNRKPGFSPLIYQNAQVGYGFSAGYTYNSLIDLFSSLKIDKSSVLPAKLRTNPAWAIGSGFHWDKLLNISWLSNFTTRFSYGYLANLAGVQKSQTIPIFSYSNNYYDQRRELSMQTLYNSKLKPEQTHSLEIGTSLGFFGRYSIGIQWYNRYINNALLDIPIAPSIGYSDKEVNIGTLKNTGVEITLYGTVYQSDDFTLSLRGNMAYNDNLVLSLYDKKEIFSSEDALIPDYQVGMPYNLLWGWKSLGINPISGYPTLRTNDGKEKPLGISMLRKDFVILGRSVPPLSGSFGLSFSYKSLDFDCQFYYNLGGVKSTSFAYIRNNSNANENAPAGLIKRTWFKRHDENRMYPSPLLNPNVYSNYVSYPNSRLVFSSNFLKFSFFSIKYRVPSDFIKKYTKNTIKYLSLSLQGSNLFLISPYNNGSPEAASTNVAVQPIISFNTTINF